ncbi:hypothetical protein LXL04_017610 [Taraxacum kok-saghyz]
MLFAVLLPSSITINQHITAYLELFLFSLGHEAIRCTWYLGQHQIELIGKGVGPAALVIGHQPHLCISGELLAIEIRYAILAVGAPWVFESEKYLTLQILCTYDVTLLIITGIFQHYMGYYIFTKKLKHVVRLPFSSISYGIIIMLVEAIVAGSSLGVYIGEEELYSGYVPIIFPLSRMDKIDPCRKLANLGMKAAQIQKGVRTDDLPKEESMEFHNRSFEGVVDSVLHQVIFGIKSSFIPFFSSLINNLKLGLKVQNGANHKDYTLVVVRANLNGHLKAIKGYFLLAKDDFFRESVTTAVHSHRSPLLYITTLASHQCRTSSSPPSIPSLAANITVEHHCLEEGIQKNERLMYNCKCSFLEIYNEQITDLLDPSSTNLQTDVEGVVKGKTGLNGNVITIIQPRTRTLAYLSLSFYGLRLQKIVDTINKIDLIKSIFSFNSTSYVGGIDLCHKLRSDNDFKSREGLKILILDKNGSVTNETFNVVYKEKYEEPKR